MELHVQRVKLLDMETWLAPAMYIAYRYCISSGWVIGIFKTPYYMIIRACNIECGPRRKHSQAFQTALTDTKSIVGAAIPLYNSTNTTCH